MCYTGSRKGKKTLKNKQPKTTPFINKYEVFLTNMKKVERFYNTYKILICRRLYIRDNIKKHSNHKNISICDVINIGY